MVIVPHISFSPKSRCDRVIVCQLLCPSYCPCGIVTTSNRCEPIALPMLSEEDTVKNKFKNTIDNCLLCDSVGLIKLCEKNK